MSRLDDMLKTNPVKPQVPLDVLGTCIRACLECAQSCVACADACLGEPSVAELRRCIRLNEDCADVCDATQRILSRQQEGDWELVRRTVELCALACRACGDECSRHAKMHEHCRVCAEACRACEQACHALVGKIPSGVSASRAH